MNDTAQNQNNLNTNPPVPPISPVIPPTPAPTPPPDVTVTVTQNDQTQNPFVSASSVGSDVPPPPPAVVGGELTSSGPNAGDDVNTPSFIPTYPKQGTGNRKLIGAFMGILVLAFGVTAGVLLVQQNQDIREKAAGFGDTTDCEVFFRYRCPGDTLSSDGGCNMFGERFDNYPGFIEGYCGTQQIDCLGDCDDQGKNCQIDKLIESKKDTSTCSPDTPPDNPPDNPPGNGSCGASCNTAAECSGQNPICTDSKTCYDAVTCGDGSPPDDDGVRNEWCDDVRAFDSNGNGLNQTELSQLQPGDIITLGIKGNPTGRDYDRARFTVNGTDRETTNSREAGIGFALDYPIPTGITSFKIRGAVHHEPKDRWVNRQRNNAECSLEFTLSGPTPTTTATLPPEIAQCVSVIIYDAEWNVLTSTQLATRRAGDVIRVSVSGNPAAAFDQARFIINGETRPAVTQKKPGSDEYYDEYTIPADASTFSVNAQLHHVTSNIWI